MPEISVIVPIYRTEEYLSLCVESVLAQTFTDYEVLLVDDESPDNCPKICDLYALKDNRIRVIHQKNGGLSSARNTGLAHAKGRYIYFLDSDDYISPDLLETTVKIIRIGFDAVFFSFYRVSPDGSKKRESVVSKSWEFLSDRDREDFLFNYLLQSRIPWQVWNALYDRQIIDENNLVFMDNRMIFAEDMNFNVRYCACARRIISISEPLHYYRIRQDSLSRRTNKDSLARPLFLGKMSKNALTVKQWMEKREDCDGLLSRFYLIHFWFVQFELARYDWLYEGIDPEIMREELLSDLRINGQEQFFAYQINQMRRHHKELIGTRNAFGELYRLNFAKYILEEHSTLAFVTDRFFYRLLANNAHKVKVYLMRLRKRNK